VQNGEVLQEDIPSSVIEPVEIEIDSANRTALTIGWPSVGGPHNDMIAAVRQTVTNIGSAEARPTIFILGPGRIYHIKNETTGAVINFRADLLLADDEIMMINLSDSRPQVFSDLRTNLQRFLLNGSSGLRQFTFVPGDNIISTMIGSSDNGTEVYFVWPQTNHSLDPTR
jgi:hypothetical protein